MHSRLLLVLPLVLSTVGCVSLGYYAQAVEGQFQIYSRTRPIADVIADPNTPVALKEKLREVLKIRTYASRKLGLPDNKSYRVYADLKRPYALWNVFATPELSLRPIEWCFFVTGCVAYRGYFSRARAEAFAEKLRADDDDVYVGGVTVYSTLGWFNDPMLNTFIDLPLPQIAGLVFHELAHQRLYVKGDTTFDESFAVTVELEGVRRWLQNHGTPAQFADYRARLGRREQFVALMLKYRDRLEALYRTDKSPDEKRAGKKRILAALQAEYRRVKAGWNGYRGYDAYFAQKLNNANFVSIGTYYQLVPAFQALLAHEHGDLPAFYRAVAKIGQLPPKQRLAALNAYLPRTAQHADSGAAAVR